MAENIKCQTRQVKEYKNEEKNDKENNKMAEGSTPLFERGSIVLL